MMKQLSCRCTILVAWRETVHVEGDDLNRTLVAGCPTAALFSVLFVLTGTYTPRTATGS